MNDVADIGLVYPHPKSDGSADHFGLIANERFLVLPPFERRHAGMVGKGFYSGLPQPIRQ